MNHAFALGGHALLELRSPPPEVLAWATRELAPFAPKPAQGPADVVLEPLQALEPLLELQRDAGDGLLTATDGERSFLLAGGRRCSLPATAVEQPTPFSYEPGFPLGGIYALAIRPALHHALPNHGAVALHSATAVLDGAGVVVAGWSESGKTETALGLAEEGAQFLSDKWTVLGPDGRLSAFPMRVGVRRWVLPHLPKLRRRLRPRDRGRMLVAGGAGLATRPLRRLEGRGGASGRLATMSERAVGLAERAALTLEEVAGTYGSASLLSRPVPLRATAVLMTVPQHEGVSVRPADVAWAARRLAHTAAFERRGYLSLLERARFARSGRAVGGEGLAAREEELLVRLLEPAPIFEVRAPFPTDPRAVARALMQALG